MAESTIQNRKTTGASTMKRKNRIDLVYLTIVAALLAMGLIVLLSASFAKAISENHDGYYYLKRQLFAVGIGIVLMIIMTLIPESLLRFGAVVVYFVTFILLILVFFVPTKTEHRWIYIAGFQFQPSELAKLALIIVLSWYVSIYVPADREKIPNKKDFFLKDFSRSTGAPLLIAGIYIVLVGSETHLSGAILLSVITASIMIGGGCVRWRYIFTIILPIALLALGLLLLSNAYMRERIMTLLDSDADTTGSAYQITQSIYAIGSGGMTGLGLGKSRQKYLYLPEPQNDFIFPIACEELGYIGAVLIVVLFGLLIWRGLVISLRNRDKFRSLVALGITMNLGAQICFNLLVVTAVIPVTGISLPFFSYGGTAIIAQLVEVGMMLRMSRFADFSNMTDSEENDSLDAEKATV